MNKNMRKLLAKSIVVVGSMGLALVPVYASANIEATSNQAEVAQGPEVRQAAKQYEIGSAPWDITLAVATVKLNGNKIVGVSNKGKALNPSREYEIRSSFGGDPVIKVNKDYLDKQSVGDLVLTINFDKSEPQQVTLKILPMKTEAELSELTAEYDASKENSRVETTVIFNHDNLLGIYSEGNELKYERDYRVGRTMDSMGIWFNDSFLKTLPVGENEIVFKFERTKPITFVINVVEPAKVTSTLKLELDKTTEAESNMIDNIFKLTVAGEESYDLSNLKIRYYFTADETATQNVSVDNASLSYAAAPWYKGITADVDAKVVPMKSVVATADNYLELSFTGNDVLNKETTMAVEARINKSDWSNYDQSNDYSYAKPENVCVYYNDQLISGVEPQ